MWHQDLNLKSVIVADKNTWGIRNRTKSVIIVIETLKVKLPKKKSLIICDCNNCGIRIQTQNHWSKITTSQWWLYSLRHQNSEVESAVFDCYHQLISHWYSDISVITNHQNWKWRIIAESKKIYNKITNYN